MSNSDAASVPRVWLNKLCEISISWRQSHTAAEHDQTASRPLLWLEGFVAALGGSSIRTALRNIPYSMQLLVYVSGSRICC